MYYPTSTPTARRPQVVPPGPDRTGCPAGGPTEPPHLSLGHTCVWTDDSCENTGDPQSSRVRDRCRGRGPGPPTPTSTPTHPVDSEDSVVRAVGATDGPGLPSPTPTPRTHLSDRRPLPGSTPWDHRASGARRDVTRPRVVSVRLRVSHSVTTRHPVSATGRPTVARRAQGSRVTDGFDQKVRGHDSGTVAVDRPS